MPLRGPEMDGKWTGDETLSGRPNGQKTNDNVWFSLKTGPPQGSIFRIQKLSGIGPFPAPVLDIDFIISFSRLDALTVGQLCHGSGPAIFFI